MSTAAAPANTAVATFGAGCYWGTEKFFRSNFAALRPGAILDVKVGFMGGSVENPTYRAVCGGATGHVEVAQVTFDADKASFADLCRFFFSFHDPTTQDRQGNDAGTQYASVIFTHSDAQRAEAAAVLGDLNAQLAAGTVPFLPGRAFEGKRACTAVLPAGVFYPAEDAHQLYLAKNPGGYCNHKMRFNWVQ